jgi:hypothetical protein
LEASPPSHCSGFEPHISSTSLRRVDPGVVEDVVVGQAEVARLAGVYAGQTFDALEK